jgi:hypothetical protein
LIADAVETAFGYDWSIPGFDGIPFLLFR